MARKTLSELNLSDAFLFAAVMEDPDACRLVLEQILGKRIPDMRVHAEHSILYAPSLRSIRLDVFASDKKQNRYNLEMENWEKSRRWEERYMTIGDWLHYQEEEIKQEGKQEGKQEERDRLMRLIIRMNQEGETEQLLQLEQDTGLLERLYQKYHL